MLDLMSWQKKTRLGGEESSQQLLRLRIVGEGKLVGMGSHAHRVDFFVNVRNPVSNEVFCETQWTLRIRDLALGLECIPKNQAKAL